MSRFLDDVLGDDRSVPGLLRYWSRVPVRSSVTAAHEAHEATIRKYLTAKGDARTPPRALDLLADSTRKTRDLALREIAPVLRTGLELREGIRLRPSALPHIDLLKDWAAWTGLVRHLADLGGQPAGNPIVCAGCTLVFRSRRRDERSCDMCRKRKPNPGILGGLQGDPGTSPLSVRLDELIGGAKPILELSVWKLGERVTVGAPKLRDGTQVGWREVTLGLCPECGEPLSGRAGQKTCSKACRQKRQRRAAHDSAGGASST